MWNSLSLGWFWLRQRLNHWVRLLSFHSAPSTAPPRSRAQISRPKTIGLGILSVLILTSGLGYRFYDRPKLDVGKIAPETILAPTAATVEDIETTQAKRQNARINALPGMVVDREVNLAIEQNLEELLDKGNRLREISGNFPVVNTSILSTSTQIYLHSCSDAEWQAVRETISNAPLPLTIASNPLNPAQQQAVKEIQAYRQSQPPEKPFKLLEIITQARQRYALALAALSHSSLPDRSRPYDATFLKLSNSDWQTTQIGLRITLERLLAQGIYPGLSDRDLDRAISLQLDRTLPSSTKPLATRLLSAVVIPNLKIDPEQTRLMAEKAAESIAPEMVSIEAEQEIVRAGDTITQSKFVLLDYFDLSQRGMDWLPLLGFGCLTVLGVGILKLVVGWVQLKLRRGDYLLILLLALVAPLVIILTHKFTGLPAIGLLLGSFYGSAIAMTTIGLLTVLLPIGTGIGWSVLLPSVAGGLVGSLMAGRWQFSRCQKPHSRQELAIFGGFVGLTQGMVYFIINAIGHPIENHLFTGSALNGFVGLVWSIVVLGVSPYLEHLFDLNTPIRLCELANPNQPLLKRLAQEAPGTFQHSLLVATLAEAAARSLNCNAELVRTGVLYHDIGKLHDPLAFIENQMGVPNKHDAIDDPWKSAEIIKQHVSEGLVMAKQYKLPSAIQAFIPEHQGTISIAYFYHQAQQRVLQDPSRVLRESDFRYDGPIPQSRETGIVMLADACEAALRSLEDVTHQQALTTINKILKARWREGQLADSGLKREEMAQIAQIFVQAWQQFHHKRIVYPKFAPRSQTNN